MTHCNRTSLKPLQASLGMSSRISALDSGPPSPGYSSIPFFFSPQTGKADLPEPDQKNMFNQNSGAVRVQKVQTRHRPTPMETCWDSVSAGSTQRNYGLWSERSRYKKNPKVLKRKKNHPRQRRLTIICKSVGSWWWERQPCDPEWVRVQPWDDICLTPKTYNYTHLNVKRCFCRRHVTTQRRTFLFLHVCVSFAQLGNDCCFWIYKPSYGGHHQLCKNAAALTKSIFWEMNGITVIEIEPAATKPLMVI